MKRRYLCRVRLKIGFLIFCVVTTRAWADDTVDGAMRLGEESKYEVGRYLSLLIDETDSLTISDISSPAHLTQMKSYHGKYPNLGLIDHPVWISFQIDNPYASRAYILSYNYPIADSVELYEPRKDGGFSVRRAGEWMRDSDVSFRHRRFVFILDIPKGKTEYFLRVHSPRSGATILLTLWSPRRFAEYERIAIMVYGFLAGPTIFFALYFVLMAIRLRERMELWFAVYLIMLGSLAAIRGGILQDLLAFIGTGAWNVINVATIGASIFTGVAVFRLYHNLMRRSPLLNRILLVFQWLGLAFIPLSFGPRFAAYAVEIILFAVLPLMTTIISFTYWRKGDVSAGFFAFGWLAVNAALVIEFSRITGIIGWQPFMFGTLLTALWWSLVFYNIALIRRIHGYKKSSLRDSLTGLSNRGSFDDALRREWYRSCRNVTPLSLLMIDVDYFKRYNDSHGHRAGDDCLRLLADYLRKSATRSADVCARYGGEEFTILLPDTDIDGAEKVAATVHNMVRSHGANGGKGPLYPFTVSIGIAAVVGNDDGDKKAHLVEQADRALYKAKMDGRNRTAVHQAT